jgi:ATP-dependent Lhr-like helicase
VPVHSFHFHPVVARWFEQKFGSPTEPQRCGWPAIQESKNVLIAAPTGSGKTLAAFFASLDQLFREGLENDLPNETRVVYVSPLKALSNDIHKNLEEPLEGLRAALLESERRDIPVRAEVRTGDTPASKRVAIGKKPPHILVTTPESLYLMLTSESGRKVLSTVRTLIVDEIHALVGNRRGSHLALSMERLATLVKHPLQRIGLSATQKPIEEVARFLVGTNNISKSGKPNCTIVDSGYARKMDLAIELPGSPLEAVMSNEVWDEVYQRLCQLIDEHRTTLIFVNTRRLAERVTHQLAGRLGKDKVTSHHGSLSAKLRFDAENRLKRGDLKALVATASLELGIDIGSVDLVCQIGPTRSIATLLQRAGRADHRRGGMPKARLFPLSRDELVETVATIHSIRKGELDAIIMPEKPLDVLAQQMVAAAACEDLEEEQLFNIMGGAYPYRHLSREEFDEVLRMLAEGFTTKRGRRAALVHHDSINHRVRGRRGARLTALTSGGAIPDNADYRVVVEPGETYIGTLNEDFAIESLAGDIFQLGNASWKILRVGSGVVRVQDAHGQPPSMPFWLGEAPGRTAELSQSISNLREDIFKIISAAPPGQGEESITAWLETEIKLSPPAARQLANYFAETYKSLGVIPSQKTLVIERFFDESGGMQLVIHSPFGIRVNRGWGLALRKRFCRSFNFELQAAATDDAIVLSLGTTHSFPLDEVFRYLNSKTVRDILIQALLDSPMFPTRWRWNASRALALPRHRGGHKIPAALQRMESENLLSAVFPDQLACLENIVGDRVVPDHPLVKQTVDDCLVEAMDIDGLIDVIKRIESGAVKCIARDLPEPSPLAHEILNAKPYAFLDDAPLEERRTHAVYTRRAGQGSNNQGLGILDAAAIDKVVEEAWPQASNADELHEALLLIGAMTDEEVERTSSNREWLDSLIHDRRAGRLSNGFWIAAERLPMLRTVFLNATIDASVVPPVAEQKKLWEESDAVRELVRGRMEVIGPTTATALEGFYKLPRTQVDAALLALEAEGFILRGKFHPDVQETEWCDRRLLARIHRLTINRLRAEIQAVTLADFQRFLLAWQHVGSENRVEGVAGVDGILTMLDGFQTQAAAWEPEVLALRVKDYTPQWLDQLCFTGRIGWGRLAPTQNKSGRPNSPIRSSPISIFSRSNAAHWLSLSFASSSLEYSPDTKLVLESLQTKGASFFGEIAKQTGILPSRVEQSLAELVANGVVTSDSFEGLRALLIPSEKRIPFADSHRTRHHKSVTSVEFAGRWSLLRSADSLVRADPEHADKAVRAPDEAIEAFARTLLRRYGIVFRRMIERESLNVSWFELGRVFRRLEARGEIRGGYFVSGVSGEQFALPEAIGLLRSMRKAPPQGELIAISGADPLNLAGILAPGPKVTAITGSRILLRDGVPIAALEGGNVVVFDREVSGNEIERALKVGTMPLALRRYYS